MRDALHFMAGCALTGALLVAFPPDPGDEAVRVLILLLAGIATLLVARDAGRAGKPR